MRMIMDADSFIYSTVAKCQKPNPFKEGEMVADWSFVKNSFDKKHKLFMEKYKVDELIMYISGDNNFRYDIYPEYKANRFGVERPPLLDELKDYCVEKYGAIRAHGAEADDYVIAHKLREPEMIVAAIDKDVKNFIAGKHFDYWKEEFFEVDEMTAMKWPYIQTLMGDSSDNIVGLHRVGIKTAEKLLLEAREPSQCWEVVVSTYKDKGRTEEDAILNMRLVRMDQFDGELKLWEPNLII